MKRLEAPREALLVKRQEAPREALLAKRREAPRVKRQEAPREVALLLPTQGRLQHPGLERRVVRVEPIPLGSVTK